MLAPTFGPSLTIFSRPTLRIVLDIRKARSCLVGAPSLRNAPGSQKTRIGDQTMHRYL